MHSPRVLAQFVGLAAIAGASRASGASGRQSAPGSGLQSFLINYNFETYPSTSSQVPVAATIIGDYDLLNFNTALINQTQPPVAGVACHTAPACTAFTLGTSLLAALTPGQTSSNLIGPAVITSAYEYSPISYFNPYVFYYGCVVADANGVASTPASCTITATGFNVKGREIYSQDFKYTATGALLQQMTLGYFNQGWSGLQVSRLEFTVTNNATTAALVDNFLATVYGPQNAAINIDF